MLCIDLTKYYDKYAIEQCAYITQTRQVEHQHQVLLKPSVQNVINKH